MISMSFGYAIKESYAEKIEKFIKAGGKVLPVDPEIKISRTHQQRFKNDRGVLNPVEYTKLKSEVLDWCDARRGRTKRLIEITGFYKCYFSHLKSGKTQCSQLDFEKIQLAKAAVIKEEGDKNETV